MTATTKSWSKVNRQTESQTDQDPPPAQLPVDVRASRSVCALALAGALALVLLFVFVELVGGLGAVISRPVLGADYQTAANYVAAQHLPGQPVLIALPPPGYLALDERDDLVFLASSLEAPRAQRYTRRAADGSYVDFWLGVPAIVSSEQLCSAIGASPDLWLVVDETRLNRDWAFAGPMADAIRASTHEVFNGDGGVTVRRPNIDAFSPDSPCAIHSPRMGAH